MDEKLLEFYSETDPEKRGEIIKALTETGEHAAKKRLYDLRYTDKGADRMISIFLALLTMAGNGGLFLKHTVKSIKKDMEDAGFKEALSSEDGSEALYLEIKNGMKRYLETCKGDLYGAGFSGLLRLDDAGREAKTRRDLKLMTEGALFRAAAVEVEGFTEYMEVLCRAVRDAYREEKEDEL